jgi:uncharacterized protein (TIGR03435 family)
LVMRDRARNAVARIAQLGAYMYKGICLIAIAVVALGQTIAQPDDGKPKFEVAVIKAIKEGKYIQPTGGPGTKEPSTYHCQCTVGMMLRPAFGLGGGDFVVPDWVWGKQLFLLTAKVPAGTTKEQVPIMLQEFLKERFHLTYHFEKRELPGYRMAVAKNGPKLKEAVVDPDGADQPTLATKIDKDGFPNAPGLWRMPYGSKFSQKKQTMSQVTTFVAFHAFKPVVDATGLTGEYDITLYWESDQQQIGGAAVELDNVPSNLTPAVGQTFQGALQSQLGLRLEPAKVTLNVFVLDHLDKMPTEN